MFLLILSKNHDITLQIFLTAEVFQTSIVKKNENTYVQ
jgi:hypothetical protein